LTREPTPTELSEAISELPAFTDDDGRPIQSKPGKSEWIDVSKLPGEEGREDQQAGWQEFAGRLFNNVTILDVGAGLGNSRERLAVNGNIVTLQDVGPGLPVDLTYDVGFIPRKSYDVVMAFDVIEHVANDVRFFENLCRIARKAVFISTPNELVSRARNRRHVREYSPRNLVDFLPSYLSRVYFAGDESGYSAHRIINFLGHREPHHAVLCNLLE
jgi:hypothetical protein